MTDSTAWQPPAAAATPAPAPFPAQTEGSAGGQSGAPSGRPSGPQGTPGWTAPPRPGLIPLRPLTLGTLLGAAFQVLRRNPRPTFGFSLLVTGVVSILTLVVVGAVTYFAVSRTLNASAADAAALGAGSVAIIILSALIPAALSIVASAVLSGIISLEVARGTVGERLRIGGLWRAARGRIGALIGWSLLIASAVIVTLAVVATLIALIIAFGGVAGIVIGVLLGLLAGAGAIVLYAWLGTRLSLVPSALMLERLPLRAALARSWSLTFGFFWRTLGIQLLVIVIVQTVASIITAPLQILFGFGSFLLNPTSQDGGVLIGAVVLYGLTLLLTILFGSIAAVVQAATPALIYIDLRMRKEGLDLELARFVEARQAGDGSIADPYLARTTPSQASGQPSGRS